MELDVQDWLIVIGALLIVGVLLDAYRRLRNERRNPYRMSNRTIGPGDGFRERADPESTVPELPMGGARVVVRDDNDESEAPARSRRREPRLDSPPAPEKAPAKAPLPPRAGSPSGKPVAPVAAEPAPPTFPDGGNTALASPPGKAVPGRAGSTPTADPVSEEVVLIRVFARADTGFAGKDIQRIFKECDVRFGDRRIFHRHEEAKGQGAVQFSVANVVEPGTFSADAMDEFTTPGLSFFMLLPGPQKPLEAFDCMLETARAIAKYLEGELRDQSNSVFTQQTGEHCRQRIREYALRARTRR